MAQNRVEHGNSFEKLICERMNWKHVSKSPKIVWSGIGRSNFKKIESINFDANKFIPSDKSDYTKYDAINSNNEFVEIKKYTKSLLKEWKLYSEPMFKVADWKTLTSVINIFGNDGIIRNLKLIDVYPQCPPKYKHTITGNKELAIERYNTFVDELSKSEFCKEIIENITNSNIGIQLEDGFITKSDLEFRWNTVVDWGGFKRFRIEFRLK